MQFCGLYSWLVLLLAFGVDGGTGTMDEGLRFLVSSLLSLIGLF